jgi:hypothetical protein
MAWKKPRPRMSPTAAMSRVASTSMERRVPSIALTRSTSFSRSTIFCTATPAAQQAVWPVKVCPVMGAPCLPWIASATLSL